MTFTLMLLRHAKSSHAEGQMGDHDRPLSDRGRRDAPRIARYLESSRLKPDMVLCSTAVRARQTLEPILSIWPDIPVSFEDGLYLCTTEDAIRQLRAVTDANRVLLVGHNPTMEDLVGQLFDRKLDHQASLPTVFRKYPTGTLTELLIHKPSWADLTTSCAQIIRFVPPRTLDN